MYVILSNVKSKMLNATLIRVSESVVYGEATWVTFKPKLKKESTLTFF